MQRQYVIAAEWRLAVVTTPCRLHAGWLKNELNMIFILLVSSFRRIISGAVHHSTVLQKYRARRVYAVLKARVGGGAEPVMGDWSAAREMVEGVQPCAFLLARLMGQYCFARWRLSSSSSVGVCNTTAGLQAASRAQTRRWRHAACSLIIAHSSTVHGNTAQRPVRLRTVRATPCYTIFTVNWLRCGGAIQHTKVGGG